MISFKTIRENSNIKSFLTLAEREMTPAQMKKREEIAQSMSDADFKKRYGKDWMAVKMATATKQAMKEDQDVEEVYIDHWCAKHVYHDVFGEGVVVEGEHAVPDENGKIEWYTVEFAHGKETVFTEDVEVMHERMHGHMMKKKRKMSEMDDECEMDDEDDEDDEEEMMKKKQMGEALVGQQHKIDMNKNQKIDAQDFHLLRKIKKARAK